MSRAHRSTISAITRVFARYGAAVQNRDHCELGAWNGPDSAVQRYTLRCARDTDPGDALPVMPDGGYRTET